MRLVCHNCNLLLLFICAGSCALLLLPSAVTATSVVATFQRGSANLPSGSYQLTESAAAKSDLQCVERAAWLSSVQLVVFKTGQCELYSCSGGNATCTVKCRVIFSGSQTAWVRSSHAASCWVTVQHRVSGSVDFYRNWSDYKAGFGDGENGNFWIGLESLRSLSSRTLRIELILWNDTVYWAEMSSFSLSPESNNYTITWSTFTGTLQDSMSSHKNRPFSTKDRNNCICGGPNCAVTYKGAWWFSCCHNSHLNAEYYNYSAAVFSTLNAAGIAWYNPFGFSYSMKEAEMLIL